MWCTSWNMACFNGDFKAIGFLESVGAWSAINEQAISYAIRGGNLKGKCDSRHSSAPISLTTDTTLSLSPYLCSGKVVARSRPARPLGSMGDQCRHCGLRKGSWDACLDRPPER